jgi:hypothetical protein
MNYDTCENCYDKFFCEISKEDSKDCWYNENGFCIQEELEN